MRFCGAVVDGVDSVAKFSVWRVPDVEGVASVQRVVTRGVVRWGWCAHRKLKPHSPAEATRRRRPRFPLEDQLGVEIEPIDRQRALQPGNDFRADAHFGALGSIQPWNAVSRIA